MFNDVQTKFDRISLGLVNASEYFKVATLLDASHFLEERPAQCVQSARRSIKYGRSAGVQEDYSTIVQRTAASE